MSNWEENLGKPQDMLEKLMSLSWPGKKCIVILKEGLEKVAMEISRPP